MIDEDERKRKEKELENQSFTKWINPYKLIQYLFDRPGFIQPKITTDLAKDVKLLQQWVWFGIFISDNYANINKSFDQRFHGVLI